MTPFWGMTLIHMRFEVCVFTEMHHSWIHQGMCRNVLVMGGDINWFGRGWNPWAFVATLLRVDAVPQGVEFKGFGCLPAGGRCKSQNFLGQGLKGYTSSMDLALP